MKPISLKTKMQNISQNEMQNIVGGSRQQDQLKTVTVIGHKKNVSKMMF